MCFIHKFLPDSGSLWNLGVIEEENSWELYQSKVRTMGSRFLEFQCSIHKGMDKLSGMYKWLRGL